MTSIKHELNLDTIHFRALRSFEQRAYVAKEFSNSPFEYINVIIDTHKLDLNKLLGICATSMFYYHETNRYGFVMPCYTDKLRNSLYKRNGKILKYGMKYYTDFMEPENDYFSSRMICK